MSLCLEPIEVVSFEAPAASSGRVLRKKKKKARKAQKRIKNRNNVRSRQSCSVVVVVVSVAIAVVPRCSRPSEKQSDFIPPTLVRCR